MQIMILRGWLQLLLGGGIYTGLTFLFDHFLLDEQHGFFSYLIQFVVFTGIMAGLAYYLKRKKQRKNDL